MINLDIQGFRPLKLSHLVLDFNGTLALDGALLAGVAPLLSALAQQMTIHVVTGNTHGTAQDALHGLDCNVVLLPPQGQAMAKREFVQQLGADATVVIGNGRNDVLMMQVASLAIAVIEGEGGAYEALSAADVVTTDIQAALGLLLHPKRLIATLRA